MNSIFQRNSHVVGILRVLSILMIVLYHFNYHATAQFHLFNANTLGNYVGFLGHLGVSFFIILSGISVSYFSKTCDTSSFYKKRWLKLLPSYYLAYIFGFVLFYFLNLGNVVHFKTSAYIWTLLGLDGYLYKTIETNYILGEWFLGFILIIYVIYPFLNQAYKKHPLIVFFLSLLLSFLSIKYNSNVLSIVKYTNPNPFWRPMVRLPEFLFGMSFVSILLNYRKYLLAFSVIFLIIEYDRLIYMLSSNYSDSEQVFIDLILFMSAFSLIYYALFAIRNIRFYGVVSYLSRLSYGVFLVHHVILISALLLVARMNLNTSYFSLLFFVLVLSLVVSFFIFYIDIKIKKLIFNMG